MMPPRDTPQKLAIFISTFVAVPDKNKKNSESDDVTFYLIINSSGVHNSKFHALSSLTKGGRQYDATRCNEHITSILNSNITDGIFPRFLYGTATFTLTL